MHYSKIYINNNLLKEMLSNTNCTRHEPKSKTESPIIKPYQAKNVFQIDSVFTLYAAEMAYAFSGPKSSSQ